MSIKNELDQYYTNPQYAKDCYDKSLQFISERMDISTSYYLEPCVGTGSFYLQFPEDRRYGYDIEPVHLDENVEHSDFLLEMGVNVRSNGEPILVISNPPFGKISSLAIKFFNKCASMHEVKYICFIVPKTFRKVATQNKLHANFHLVLDEDSPHDAFILHGEPHHVPCVFQIWERRDDETRDMHSIKNVSDYFQYCTKDEADIFIKRVGTKAGEYAPPGKEHKDASMYYIKTDYIDEIIDVLQSDDYMEEIKRIRKTTAGVFCVSKSELVLNIEKRLKI